VKVERADDFAAVGAAAWDRLLERSTVPTPFQSWAWQTAWFEVFADGRRLQLLGVRDDAGELVGLLPLYEHAPKRLRPVGGLDVSDYLDVIAESGREGEVWAALLQTHSTSDEGWELHSIRSASPTATLVPALAPAYGLRVERVVTEHCPVLDLPRTWDAYLALLSAKQRHELLRKLRRIERERPGAVAVAHTGPEAVGAHLSEFFRLHRGSRTGKARFMDARMERFFRTAIGALAARDAVRLWMLEVQGQAIATFVCLEWPGHVGLYNSGFDPSQAALSPGIVLVARVIRDAIERAVPRFDFLRGDEPYKLALGGRPEALCEIRVGR
jgi:CelD/BcsL family acetyltransferase involved in cellulose biosynthesis